MSKILLDTGSSGPYGWSSISRFMRCPQLYFWHERVERETRESRRAITQEEPLVRGSIVHAGLAHLYMRQLLAQAGRRGEWDLYYSPSEAMALVAEKFGATGDDMLPVARRVVEGYVARYATEELKTLAVELKVETEFCGHPYTARIDRVYEDAGAKVWIVDHKCVSKLEGKVYRRYLMSGQILGLWHIGARTYGERFGGVQLNFLGVNPMAFDRVTPDPAPWMLERFPGVVARAHEGIARCRAELARDPNWIIPATPSEYTCYPYNRPCHFFEACRWGEALEPVDITIEDE